MSKKSTTDFYALLGVTKDADAATIKKAFRKLAITAHPDKGGNTETWNKLSQAYEVLSDDGKRRLYDLGGMDAVENGGSRHGGRPAQKVVKGDPVNFPLNLSLEDIYSGAQKKLKLTRTVCCKGCNGKGGTDVVDCASCDGRGVKITMQRLGPGMVTQSQSPCNICRGEGRVVAAGKQCRACMGQKTLKEVKQLTIDVPRGAQVGQTVLFRGDGDELPGQLAGDVIVEFAEKKHSTFTRNGFHLFIKQRITLLQALVGCTFFIEHLDGHQVEIVLNQVIEPGTVLCIPEEGLAHSYGRGRGIETGNLYVEFEIEFPTTQHMNQIKQQAPQAIHFLSSLLPNGSYVNTSRPTGPTAEAKGIKVPQGIKVTNLAREKATFDREQRQWTEHKQQQDRDNTSGSAGGGFDDEDDMGGGGQGMACQQM